MTMTIGEMKIVDERIDLINQELGENWLSTCHQVHPGILSIYVLGSSDLSFQIHRREIPRYSLVSMMKKRLNQVLCNLNEDIENAMKILNIPKKKSYIPNIQGL